MRGAELAIRFSFMPNRLHYCGPARAEGVFLDYFKKSAREREDLEKEIESNIKRFEGLYPYLKLIADKSKKYILDYEVVEAYWIGNKLLDSFDSNDMKRLLSSLVERGLPKSMSESLIASLPDGMFPHHNFNVFYVGPGNITGSVKATLQTRESCRPGWGRVLSVGDCELMLDSLELKLKGSKYVLEPAVKKVSYEKIMLPRVKPGDVVGIHWNLATMVLSEQQVESLDQYTQKMLGIINRFLVKPE